MTFMTPEPINRDPLAAAHPEASQPRELDLFAFGLMLLRNLPFILGCGLVAFLLMVAAMLHAKPRYAATAVMIVPQGNVASAALGAQLSLSTIDLLGGGYELYGDMLRSRSIADRLIEDYDLKKAYHCEKAESLDVCENQLAAMTKVETLREGVVRVTVQDTSPERAAGLANDYLHQLDILNSHLVLTSVGEERKYLEGEMIKEKDALADAEVALKQVQESTSGVAPEAAASAQLSALESTRVQLRADQIRLASLLVAETEENPEVIRLRSQIAGLNSQLEQLQRGEASSTNGTPTSQVPEQTLIYTRRLRDVKFHETLFGLLEKQFEEAKEQEAKTPTIVQVLDPAVPSRRKAWPPRTYYCIMAGIFGIIAGVLLVALRAIVLSYLRNPANVEKLKQLKTFYHARPKQQS
jgi:tyrosine-protein kinase Etk/Wzc